MLIINKVLSNEYSIAEFGRYNVIRRSASVLTFLLLGGMGITLPRYLAIALAKRRVKEIKTTIVSSIAFIAWVSTVVLIVYICLKSVICKYVTGNDSWYEYFVLYLYSFVSCLVSYLVAYYRGLDRFKEFNIVQITFQLIMLIPLMFHLDGIVNLFLWWSVIQFALLIVFFVKETLKFNRVFKIIIPRAHYILKTKELSKYSLPRLFGDFILFAMSVFPLLYIGETMSMESVSYFSVGITLFMLSTPIFSFLGVIMLPYVARLITDNNAAEAKRFVGKLSKYYIIIAAIINCVTFVFMKWMIMIFFSADYYAAITPSRIISLALIPASIYYLYRNPIDAVSVRPYNTYILTVCFILLILGFIAVDGINHLAIVYSAVFIIQGILSWMVWNIIINKNIKNRQI